MLNAHMVVDIEEIMRVMIWGDIERQNKYNGSDILCLGAVIFHLCRLFISLPPLLHETSTDLLLDNINPAKNILLGLDFSSI